MAWALARARERSFRSPVAKQIVSSHASPLLAHIADFSLQANENNPAPPPTHTATHESRSRDEYGSTDHGSRSEQEPEASPAMSLRKDAGFTVECVASLLHSCGVLRRSKPDSQLLDALILEAVAGVGAGRMKASDLSRCMWALTRLDLPDMAFLKIVTRAVVMDGAMKGGKAQVGWGKEGNTRNRKRLWCMCNSHHFMDGSCVWWCLTTTTCAVAFSH